MAGEIVGPWGDIGPLAYSMMLPLPSEPQAEEVSTMANIERLECGRCGGIEAAYDDADECFACGYTMRRVRYVAEAEVDSLRQQLDGAVEQLERARLMAHSPGRDPAAVLRDVRGALGLDRNTADPAGGR